MFSGDLFTQSEESKSSPSVSYSCFGGFDGVRIEGFLACRADGLFEEPFDAGVLFGVEPTVVGLDEVLVVEID